MKLTRWSCRWLPRLALGATLLMVPLLLHPQSSPGDLAAAVVRRPAKARGTVVIPETFLRRWDAITLFFDHAAGPASGGPEDHPEAHVTLEPIHAGAWTWIDDRTLQFRPAVPWPPLARFTLTVEGVSHTLTTLMAAPLETLPANNAAGLLDVDSLTLSFADPIEPVSLARMIDIALIPLSSVEPQHARHLTADDFAIKPIERQNPGDPARYVVALQDPIPPGTRVIVSFRLSLQDAEQAIARLTFATAEPFHVTRVGCGTEHLPIGRNGAHYGPSQAIECPGENRSLQVTFSAPLGDVDPLAARRFVRIDPPIAERKAWTWDDTLSVTGRFEPGRLYHVHLASLPLQDVHGRRLTTRVDSDAYFSFPPVDSYLRWGASRGVLERYGPRMVPLEGVGDARADLRIYPIPPLERSLWPFPEQPVIVDESQRPPGPGEGPLPPSPDRRASADSLARHISTLGTPPVSTLVDLHPMTAQSGRRFGLDLTPYLEAIDGRNAPGTYLVGIRRLDGSTTRAWMRVQVTDLALSAAETSDKVEFFVTSLSKGTPISSAEVVIEGSTSHAWGKAEWTTLARLVTDRQGRCTFAAPGDARPAHIGRVVVRKQDDTLVVDPQNPPRAFRDDHWMDTSPPWLGWAFTDIAPRRPPPRTLCHIFPERPVYRPDEPVHIKGYVRRLQAGKLTIIRPDATLHLDGPGGVQWDYGLRLTEAGSFYFLFDEENMPAGTYTGHLAVDAGHGREATCGVLTFRKEAYRLPRFEVHLHGPDHTPLDKPFEVSLSATYYAGGPVAGRPVRWRVTQYPHPFEPPRRKGFFYSSDGRFSEPERFRSTPRLTREDVTGEDGMCRITLDPTIEPTAQPRSYVVEATVTGDDDHTVTTTRRFVALPPFVLGVRAPRFVSGTTTVTPEIIMIGPEGDPIPDRQVTVRLIHRQWQSHLQAADFTDGVARYLTETVDTQISQTLVVTERQPVAVPMTLPRSGVYLVEVSARDGLGRAQVVTVDLYAGGDEPVGWQKPEQQVITVAPDRTRYDPGDTATLVIQSPFQTARALVVVEAPEGNTYRWIRVRGGAATVTVPIQGDYAPRIPVHTVVMRGRVDAPPPLPSNLTDLGKPTTVAATTWLTVTPRDNRLIVTLEHPDKALPGETIPLTIRLSDPDGRRLPGEVTLWLVDQAVLSLGAEQRIDPLPDFMPPRDTHWLFRDTRDWPFGRLPVAIPPGGGEGTSEPLHPLDHVTVRRNFCPVPYYHPEITIGPTGVATVQVPLGDDVTNFKIRAKAVSGDARFGYATGMVSVRLPVVIQPSLPRFVRPGDRFLAGMSARVLEGPGGKARARIQVSGGSLPEGDTRDFALTRDHAQMLTFPVQVPVAPSAGRTSTDTSARTGLLVRVQAARLSDGVGDGFEVTIPITSDQRAEVTRRVAILDEAHPFSFPEVPKNVRPGSLSRNLMVSNQPLLVTLAEGLDFLLRYPYGCTEQRVSRASAMLATRAFRTLLDLDDGTSPIDAGVREVLDWIPRAIDRRDLVAYWPGGRGYVSLTAWTLEFLERAHRQGYPVDDDLRHTLKRALRRALRSDTTGLIDGEEDTERTMALLALTEAGDFDPGYAAELARRAAYLDTESKARIALAFAKGGRSHEGVAQDIAQDLWHGVVLNQHEGRLVFSGLQERRGAGHALLLPSDARSLARIVQALHQYAPADARLPALVEGLTAMAGDGGWGTTNANAAAMIALSDLIEPPLPDGLTARVRVQIGRDTRMLEVSGSRPAVRMAIDSGSAVQVTCAGDAQAKTTGTKGRPEPLVVRLVQRYVSSTPGSQVEAASHGFVITRQIVALRPDGAAIARHPLDRAGTLLEFMVGDLLEEQIEVVNPSDRHHVVIEVPLAAGIEPLNPALATAPPEARPEQPLAGDATTHPPTHVAMLDDRVTYHFDTLPKGTYGFRFRTRSTVPGRYVQPPAFVQMMYDLAVTGRTPGAEVQIDRNP